MKRLSTPRTLMASVAVAIVAATSATSSISGHPGSPCQSECHHDNRQRQGEKGRESLQSNEHRPSRGSGRRPSRLPTNAAPVSAKAMTAMGVQKSKGSPLANQKFPNTAHG